MKRETAFVGAMFVFGIVTGLFLVVVLMAFVLMAFGDPTSNQYFLTIAEKADWDRISMYAGCTLGPISIVLYGVFLALLLFVIFLFLLTINPHVKNALKNWKSIAGAKLLVVTVLALCLIYLLVFWSDSMFTMEQKTSKAIQFIIFIIATAGLWFVAGAEGWAGDYSSWRLAKDSKPVRVLLLGAAAGSIFFVVHQLFDWSSKIYFILVSEVLNRSGETSFHGFKLLAAGNMLCFGLELSLFAAIVNALAPVCRENSEMRRRLAYPAVALTAIAVLVLAAYAFAGKKYDLDKTSFATVLGIPDKARESRTIVVLLPSKELPVTIQEWPLQVTGWGLGVQTTIELTMENLQKVESYLRAHPDGSIFTYAANDILMKGYYALWDVKNGFVWHVKTAESRRLSRLLLLPRFRSMQLSEENLKLLESYSDEKKWYFGGKSALSLSMAYQHFGKIAEAERWLQKAKDQGVEIPDTNFMKEPVVANGAISGKISSAGKPLSGYKVALLGHPTAEKQLDYSYKVMELTLPRQLVDVKKTDKDGGFVFSSLGSGTYLLAIMTDKDVIPFDLKPGSITASNIPGLISIGQRATRDLGTISIMLK